MRFEATAIPGAFVIDPELLEDERGFFARTFCAREFEQQGLNPNLVQCSISFNRSLGTLRGMHYQAAPYEEAKLVRCTRGAIWDVIVDLRPASGAHKRWLGVRLDAANRRVLYVPEGVAHGFETLEPETEVLYQISQFYSPGSARGVRWNDPAFGIEWPLPPQAISERDRGYLDYQG